jgi:hypothetical protein
VAVAFDTLAHYRRLKSAGIPDAQAEAQAEALAQVVGETLATKQDVRRTSAACAIAEVAAPSRAAA